MGKSDSEENSVKNVEEESNKFSSSEMKEDVIQVNEKNGEKSSDQDKKEQSSLKRREKSISPKRREREDKSPPRRRQISQSSRRKRRDSRSPRRRQRSRSPRRSSLSRNRSPHRERRYNSSRSLRDDSMKRKDISPSRKIEPPYSKKEDEPPAKKKKPDELNTKTGGAYIHPAKLRMMQEAITDKNSEQYQRLSWEALKKSINGLINKVNVANIKEISREIFQENIVRGRGILAQSIILAQNASPTFTQVYAALTSIINCRFPQNGELILRRVVTQFRRSYRRNIKDKCLHSVQFIAHLINSQVAHEILGLQILTLLLETPTDDSVEVAVGFLKEVGMKLGEVSPRGLAAVFERLRSILHEKQLEKRVQYMIEVMFAIRKDGFKEHPSMINELDLVSESEQFTHMLTLDDDNLKALETGMNVFKFDPEFQTSEENYKKIKKDILDESSDDDDSSGSGDSSAESSSDEEGEDETKATMEITDKTETNLVALRRTIYLAIQSSLTFEECAHKILKMEFAEQDYSEICSMVIDCCSQQRTYEKFFGLLGGRFCLLRKEFMEHFERLFTEQYDTIHRLETNKLRNVAKFFAHLLHSDALPWSVLSCIHLSMDTTTSSSRIFIKILFQEIVEFMGITKLNERLKDVTLAPFFEGLFPKDNPQNTRFAINFFTSIGLGGVTDELRDHLQTVSRLLKQKLQEEQLAALAAASSDDSSSDEDESSSSSEEERVKIKKRKNKFTKKSKKAKSKKKRKHKKKNLSSSESEEREKKNSHKNKKVIMSSDDEKENACEHDIRNRDKRDNRERNRYEQKNRDKIDAKDNKSMKKYPKFDSQNRDIKSKSTRGHDTEYNVCDQSHDDNDIEHYGKHEKEMNHDNSKKKYYRQAKHDDRKLSHGKLDHASSPIVKRESKLTDENDKDVRKNRSHKNRHHENRDSRREIKREITSLNDYEFAKSDIPDNSRKNKDRDNKSRYDDAKNNRDKQRHDDDHKMKADKSRYIKNVIVRHESPSDSSDQNERKLAQERRKRENGRKRNSSSPERRNSYQNRKRDSDSSNEIIDPPKLVKRKVEVISIASKLRRPRSSDSSDSSSDSGDSSSSSNSGKEKKYSYIKVPTKNR